MSPFILGAVATLAFVAALFFFHYYRLSRDRFFLLFGIAFALLAFQWTMSGIFSFDDESRPLIYLARLAAFLVIIGAIVDKNRRE